MPMPKQRCCLPNAHAGAHLFIRTKATTILLGECAEKPMPIQLHDTVRTSDGVEGCVLATRNKKALIGYGQCSRSWRQISALVLVSRHEPKECADPFATLGVFPDRRG